MDLGKWRDGECIYLAWWGVRGGISEIYMLMLVVQWQDYRMHYHVHLHEVGVLFSTVLYCTTAGRDTIAWLTSILSRSWRSRSPMPLPRGPDQRAPAALMARTTVSGVYKHISPAHLNRQQILALTLPHAPSTGT